MSIFEDRKKDRELLEKFCHEYDLIGDFDFKSYSWELFLRPKLEEFLKSNNIDSNPDYYKFKCPIRFITDKFESRSDWFEYWKIENKSNDVSLHIRNNFCGNLGSRKVKRLLNSNPTIDAKILRLVFEIEDIVISSSKYYGEFFKRNMERRNRSILKLQELSQKIPEKLSIFNANNSMIVCNAELFGIKEQFCWTIEDTEKPNIREINSNEFLIRIYKESKIDRIEKLIIRLFQNGKQM